eukprot:SAG11_NODE_91_length_17102_cov_37.671343_12_plen_97_part_00
MNIFESLSCARTHGLGALSHKSHSNYKFRAAIEPVSPIPDLGGSAHRASSHPPISLCAISIVISQGERAGAYAGAMDAASPKGGVGTDGGCRGGQH